LARNQRQQRAGLVQRIAVDGEGESRRYQFPTEEQLLNFTCTSLGVQDAFGQAVIGQTLKTQPFRGIWLNRHREMHEYMNRDTR